MSLTTPASDLLTDFLAHLVRERGLSAHTLTAYGHDVGSFIGFLNARASAPTSCRDLGEIEPRTVRAWLSQRRKAGLDSPASLSRALSALRTFFTWIDATQNVENARILAMAGPKQASRLPRPTSETDTKRLIETAGTLNEEPWIAARDTALLTLIYATGLRISEALSLTGQHHPAPDMLRILGKRQKIRIVPVLPSARDVMDEYARLCPYQMSEDTPYFYAVRGGPMRPRAAQKLMQDLRGALGLPESATPHALRHAFASHLLAHNGDLRSIQALMGHASPSTTQVYLGVEDARLTQAHRLAHPRA
ncbi:MAG: recombinase XerC [Ponticaulis sp.]|nr:recombinase XerC [Ponticaulis sp.]